MFKLGSMSAPIALRVSPYFRGDVFWGVRGVSWVPRTGALRHLGGQRAYLKNKNIGVGSVVKDRYILDDLTLGKVGLARRNYMVRSPSNSSLLEPLKPTQTP